MFFWPIYCPNLVYRKNRTEKLKKTNTVMLARRLTVVLAQRSGDCCHLFWKWWLTSRSQTGRQNILKNHDNRGFLLLVMNFQNYLSVTTKRSDRYLFPQKFFMRIPSIIVICMLGVSPNFEITVACGLNFHWYFI